MVPALLGFPELRRLRSEYSVPTSRGCHSGTDSKYESLSLLGVWFLPSEEAQTPLEVNFKCLVTLRIKDPEGCGGRPLPTPDQGSTQVLGLWPSRPLTPTKEQFNQWSIQKQLTLSTYYAPHTFTLISFGLHNNLTEALLDEGTAAHRAD